MTTQSPNRIFILFTLIFTSWITLGAHRVSANTLVELQGQDAANKSECSLFVTEVGFTGPEQTPDQWYARVHTSYDHNGDSPSQILVRMHPSRPGALVGNGANGQDQIAIFLDPQNLDLNNAKSFNLKWLHGDHFHTNRCVNLSPL